MKFQIFVVSYFQISGISIFKKIAEIWNPGNLGNSEIWNSGNNELQK